MHVAHQQRAQAQLRRSSGAAQAKSSKAPINIESGSALIKQRALLQPLTSVTGAEHFLHQQHRSSASWSPSAWRSALLVSAVYSFLASKISISSSRLRRLVRTSTYYAPNSQAC